jgi:polyhydroxybutyrate depolymerase
MNKISIKKFQAIRISKQITTLVLLFAATAGRQTIAQPLSDSVLIEGNYRSFYFNKPADDTKNFEIIFVLHGSGGNGLQMMKPAARLEAISASEHVLLVYANGYKNFWNECRKAATSAANIENINEQAFFEAMLAYFHKNYQTNGNRFFVIGLSGGGHMGYKLAMTLPSKCKGISAVVANLPDTSNMDCEGTNKPVAVLISNGTADQTNPYNGGNMNINGANWGAVRSTERSFHYWSSLAGYTGQPEVQEIPDTVSNHQTITQYTYKADKKPEVTLLKVTGGQHTFPEDIDIFLESWQFFKREIAREKNKK